MGKTSAGRKVAENEAHAVLRNLRISPQKLNLVATMIRGMDAEKALAALTFSRRRISDDVKKAVQSAIANALPIWERTPRTIISLMWIDCL